MKRPRILAVALAAPALAVGVTVTSAVVAPLRSEAQTITGYYCSGAVAVPGTYGTITHCVAYAISQNSAGTTVETPAYCRLINNTGKNVNWYREAWTHWDGYIFAQTSYGTVGAGTWTENCGSALLFWRVQHEGSYTRASVQAAGSTQTAGASVPAP